MNKNNKPHRKIALNAIANLIGMSWSTISAFIFIPLYIHFLGKESYGLIGFFSVMQVALSLLGAGLASTLKREFAIGENNQKIILQKYKLLRSIENIYFAIGFLCIFICIRYSRFIVTKWLNIENININLADTSIKLMGFSIAFQIIYSLYTGCILGLEKQVLGNILSFTFSSLKALGVISVMLLISPDIRLFFLTWVVVDFIYFIVLRSIIIRFLKKFSLLSWNISDFHLLKRIWKYTIGIFGISVVSILNTQLDKVVISKYLALTLLGIYNISYSLSQLPVIFLTSLSNAIFPRFTYLFSENRKIELNGLFKKYYKLSAIIAITLGSYIGVYINQILNIWIRDPEITSTARVPTMILIVGSIFLSLQVVPYNYLLACGNTKVNNVLGVLNIFVLLGILPTLVRNYLIKGAAYSFCFIMVLSTIIYLVYFYYNYIDKKILKWIVLDTICPLFFIIFCLLLSYFTINIFHANDLIILIYAIVCGAFTLVLATTIFDSQVRVFLKSKLKIKI